MYACYRSPHSRFSNAALRHPRRMLWTGLWVLALLAASVLPAVRAECPGNALVNGGFEEGFSTRNAGEVEVANGWNPWWQDGPFQEEGQNRRPEYDPENASIHGTKRIREGNMAQKWGNVFATHHAGVYQQLTVPAGSTVTFSAWGQAWSSDNDDPNVSDGGKYGLSVGIDPTGGTDWASPNVVWSARNETLDQWVQLSVEAKTQGGTITVYLRGDAEWPVKHNDAYFDDACVTYVAPPPPPTNTPRPTDVPTATPTPEPSAVPTATPAPELGVVTAIAFDDLNGNGFREANEPLLAGARIMLIDSDGAVVAEHVTDGVSEPYAFDELEPDQYTIVEQDPPGYGSTSSNQWSVPVSFGTRLDVVYADAYAEPTPTDTPMPAVTDTPQVSSPGTGVSDSDSPNLLENYSGILVALLALVLPIGLRLLRGRP